MSCTDNTASPFHIQNMHYFKVRANDRASLVPKWSGPQASSVVASRPIVRPGRVARTSWSLATWESQWIRLSVRPLLNSDFRADGKANDEIQERAAASQPPATDGINHR
jgi:hypothetical protein